MFSRIDLRIQPECASRWFAGRLKACNAITGLTVEQGQLYAHFKSGNGLPVTVAGESRIGSRITLLKIQSLDTTSRPQLVVLINFGPGLRNVIPDEFRRLRMWLRLGHVSPSPTRPT